MERIGLDIANLWANNTIAILNGVDSSDGFWYTPYESQRGVPKVARQERWPVPRFIQQLHTAFCDVDVGTDFAFQDTPGFSH